MPPKGCRADAALHGFPPHPSCTARNSRRQRRGRKNRTRCTESLHRCISHPSRSWERPGKSGGKCRKYGERGKSGEGRKPETSKRRRGKASAPCRFQIFVRHALLPPDRNRRARKPSGVLARAVARRRGWPAPLPRGRNRRARKLAGRKRRKTGNAGRAEKRKAGNCREVGNAGNAGSTGSAGKAGNAGSRRQANGAEGKPLRRAVFRYLSGLPCCRRTGNAVPASRRAVAPGRCLRGLDRLPTRRAAVGVTAAPRRAVCRRSARPARRGSAPAGVRPSTRLPGARAVTAAPRRAVCRRSARPARRGSPAPA